ncbi:MAG: PH domain-containing protein [Alphaproteobacteria bacterium]|nr:PH domain-containing protein [Alphaproteobacteria bacterium]MBL7099454.1 PH domain-containing protein [Alphaproteobacteria bacterium]
MEEEIRGYLQPGEHLFWWGRPQQGLLITSRDIFMVPFSFVWAGFALSIFLSGLHGPVPPFPFLLVGGLFSVLGLYIAVGRFIVDAWLRRNTTYGLTDRRVLIARTGPWGNFTALQLDRLPSISLRERSNGRGTIRFGDPAYSGWPMRSNSFGSWMPSLDPTPQFLGIEDVRRVFNEIQGRSRPAGA